MLPAACLVVHELPVESDDVGEESLGEAVLAHDVHGLAATGRGEFEVTVARDDHEAVALHAGDGLRHGGPRVSEALGDARTQRHDVLLLEVEDRAQVHLRRIDEIRQLTPPRPWNTCIRKPTGPRRPPVRCGEPPSPASSAAGRSAAARVIRSHPPKHGAAPP
jgi:hypothetical protein